jgi:hypothetical protein
MEIQVEYSGLEDRQVKVKEQEAKGLRMLHDDFSPDWKPGDEPHGVMTFTDEPAPVAPTPEPLVFEPSPGTTTTKRLAYIEEFLKKIYPPPLS